jgi:hypothetical protein
MESGKIFCRFKSPSDESVRFLRKVVAILLSYAA